MLELYTDGSTRPTNPGPSGYGAAIYRKGVQIAVSSGYLGDTVTNNQAEYAAFIVGLILAKDQLLPGEDQIVVRTDSMLVVKHINKFWNLRAGKLLSLYKKADEIIQVISEGGTTVTVEHVHGHVGIPGNVAADKLAVEAVARQEPTAGWLRALLVNGRSTQDVPDWEVATSPPPGPKGHEKLRDLVTVELGKRGHRVIDVSGPGLLAARDSLKRTNEVTGSVLANLPELAVVINGRAYLLLLATGYRVEHGQSGELSVNKEALEACQRLVGAGLSVMLVHKPHGAGRWRKCNELGWSSSVNEVPTVCFDVAKLTTTREYNIGEWPTLVTIDRTGMIPFNRYIRDLE